MLLCALLAMARPASSAQPAITFAAPIERSGPEFERIVGVRELRDGSVLVADRGQPAVLHMRTLSSAPVPVGRAGSGPGEYRALGDLWPLGGDSSLLTDSYTGRWLLLEGARVVRTFPESRSGNLVVRGATDGASAAGEVVARRRYSHRGGRAFLESNSDSLVVVRAHLRSDVVDSIAVVAGHGPDGYTRIPEAAGRPTYILPMNPLGSADQVLLHADGWLAVVRARPYRVEWRRPDGTWVVGPALPAGRMAIARTERLGDARRWYDIVDRRGQLVATLTLARGEVLVGSGERWAYVSFTDEDGLQALRRYEWPTMLRGAAR